MAKQGLTELVFILDKSGSMSGLERDTIGGFNSMLAEQREKRGECLVTTVLFDSGYELLHDRVDIRAVRPMTQRDYRVGSATALLDAIGKTIRKIARAQKNTAPDFRAEHVMFVIITDGEENASREYSAAHVRELIDHERERYGWEFVFLGANIDAVACAEKFGIAADRAVDYLADPAGTQLNFEAMSQVVSSFRAQGTVCAAPFEAIRADRRKRG